MSILIVLTGIPFLSKLETSKLSFWGRNTLNLLNPEKYLNIWNLISTRQLHKFCYHQNKKPMIAALGQHRRVTKTGNEYFAPRVQCELVINCCNKMVFKQTVCCRVIRLWIIWSTGLLNEVVWSILEMFHWIHRPTPWTFWKVVLAPRSRSNSVHCALISIMYSIRGKGAACCEGMGTCVASSIFFIMTRRCPLSRWTKNWLWSRSMLFVSIPL